MDVVKFLSVGFYLRKWEFGCVCVLGTLIKQKQLSSHIHAMVSLWLLYEKDLISISWHCPANEEQKMRLFVCGSMSVFDYGIKQNHHNEYFTKWDIESR